tara:strand:- start:2992 stop:3480 length:489 start_codon:yes stop_codon:yes gene_type:complete
MIIECINCNKKFDVNSELIPNTGRTIQCGSCNHVWFFNPSAQTLIKKTESKKLKKKVIDSKKTNFEKKIHQSLKKTPKKYKKIINEDNKKNYELTPYKSKSLFSLSKLLSYIIVSIITFVALLIIIDTFKSPIYRNFPNLEIIIFSLFELLKDIELFIKDLI